MKLTCITCGKNIETDGEDILNSPPMDAVYFTSRGNYGSTVFDPLFEDEYLEMYICDECLKAKADIVQHRKKNGIDYTVQSLEEYLRYA